MEAAKNTREKYLENLNATVIYKNGDAFVFGSSAFYAGDLDNLVPFDKDFFKWNVHQNLAYLSCSASSPRVRL